MQKYSVFNLIKNALSNHENWDLAWKDPTPKKEYDVVIIGGGGHGLATAYYLAKEHNITNVAIIEKGWIGGGNVGRNTTIIRSNYMHDDNALFSEFRYSKFIFAICLPIGLKAVLSSGTLILANMSFIGCIFASLAIWISDFTSLIEDPL